MRICGFVVDTGCQIVVLDRNVDIEKSDWGFRDFPCEFEGRMERVDKTVKSFQFFFGAWCGSNTINCVAAKKFWFGTVELIENKFFLIANK